MSVTYSGDSITFGDGSIIAGGYMRNYLINGAMQIDQRYSGTGPNSVTGGDYCLDRWHHYYSGPTYTSQQSTDAPSGFRNSLLMTNTTASASPTYCFFGQRIEGLVSAPLQFGTSSAKTITVSFWVKSSVTGIYSISITNGDSNRSYAAQYTINSSDTWEYKTITIPGDTTGTWLTNNANGVYLRFNLGSPAGRLQAASSWLTNNVDGATGSTGASSWANTLGATFRITGVQLEAAETASSFEHRLYPVELALCHRYYQKWLSPGQVYFSTGHVWSTTLCQYSHLINPPMRGHPTISSSGTISNLSGQTPVNLSSISLDPSSLAAVGRQVKINGNMSSSGFTSGYSCALLINSNGAYIDLSAEL